MAVCVTLGLGTKGRRVSSDSGVVKERGSSKGPPPAALGSPVACLDIQGSGSPAGLKDTRS